MKRLIELTLRLADGTASESECRELDRLTDSDRRARRMHVEMMEIEAALRASRVEGDEADRSLTEERTVHAVLEGVRHVSPPRPPTPRFAARPIWAVLALAGVAASVALVAWPRGASKRRARAAAPSTFAFGRSRPQQDLGSVAAGSRASGWSQAPMRFHPTGGIEVSRLELEDGVALELRGKAVVRGIEQDGEGGKRVLIDEGTLSLEAAADRAMPRVIFVTPQAEVAAHARKAVLSVSADATKVDLHDGTALVTRTQDRQSVELAGRQSVLVGDEEALVARPLPAALLVGGTRSGRHPTDLLDGALARRLEGLGFAVEVVDEGALHADHLEGKALVMISPSASDILGDRIEELSLAAAGVPVICARPSLYADLSMTPPGQDARFTSNATRLTILEPTHPLAAGFSGPLQVTRAPGSLGWGHPGSGAVRVATFPDNNKNDRAVIFGYERGAPMVGPVARAPARRVGFFIHPDLAPYLTEAGWALFDAAVRWATAGV
jgi:hypothetical protein